MVVLFLFSKLYGDNAGRDGNYAVTHYHDERGKGLSERGGGCDIAIADGCQGYYCPVDTSWNVGESAFGLFNHKHKGA